jgi:dihydrofolate reductase
MRIVVSDFISLDGVVQAPGGAEEDTDGGFKYGGWSAPYFDVEVMGPEIDTLLQETDGLLFGRRTYEVMAGAWPGRAGDPFADRMNSLPKYVVSSTLTQDDLTWNNSTLLPSDDLVGSVQGLRDSDGGAIQVMGSASIATFLGENDLVDDYRLYVEPIVLGGGKRIFSDNGQARPFELVSAVTATTGVLVCTYRRAAS